jgi:hypothetical protein
MKWVKVRGQNSNFTKPKDWDEHRDGKCGTLPVRVEQEGIYNCMYSAWLPSAEGACATQCWRRDRA